MQSVNNMGGNVYLLEDIFDSEGCKMVFYGLGMIRRTFMCTNKEIILLYTALVRPRLEYCIRCIFTGFTGSRLSPDFNDDIMWRKAT